MDMLRVNLVGRLTKDPWVDNEDADRALKFCVACRRPKVPGQERAEADFIHVACGRKSADFLMRTLHKGYLVAVDGRLRIDTRLDDEGGRHTRIEVIADFVQNLTPRDLTEE